VKSKRGRVSLYSADFAGKTTANGETFDPDGLTMAHRTLPFGTRVRVTDLENQRSVVAHGQRSPGPFVAGRIADLSPRRGTADRDGGERRRRCRPGNHLARGVGRL
jgi:rare lipoprotein A